MPRLSKYIIAACSMAAAMLAASCTMIQDSVDYCPTGLYVRFVYDYNTARADMFKDHVGHVRLYVYDEQGQKVAERSVSNTAASAPLPTTATHSISTPPSSGPDATACRLWPCSATGTPPPLPTVLATATRLT